MLNPIRRKPLKGEQDQDEQVRIYITIKFVVCGSIWHGVLVSKTQGLNK